jgi:hypothetical protein
LFTGERRKMKIVSHWRDNHHHYRLFCVFRFLLDDWPDKAPPSTEERNSKPSTRRHVRIWRHFASRNPKKNPVIKVKNMRWMKGRYRRMKKKKKTKKKLSFSLSLYDIIVGYDWYCLYNSVIRLVMYSVYLKNHPSYVLRLSPRSSLIL